MNKQPAPAKDSSEWSELRKEWDSRFEDSKFMEFDKENWQLIADFWLAQLSRVSQESKRQGLEEAIEVVKSRIIPQDIHKNGGILTRDERTINKVLENTLQALITDKKL